jgi:hypothetical protein
LPYTAEPGGGVFLFTYHLFLGHLARWLTLSLETVYHAARVVNSLFFLLTAYHFIARFVDGLGARLGVWLVFALSGGLGWLAVLFGHFTGDFWIAEAIPFLTVFSNAHFPLAWALLLWLFEWTLPGLAPPPNAPRLALIAATVTALAQVQPMVLLNLGLVLGGMTVGRWLLHRQWHWPEWQIAFIAGLAAAPWMVNALWATRTNAALAVWNAQNLTPSPEWWDALLSGGVLLALTVPGLVIAARRRSPRDQILLYWFGLNVLALYAPFALQRRLSLGLWMPLTLLAWLGWQEVIAPRLAARWQIVGAGALAVLLTLTNALIVVSLLAAIQRRDSKLFLTQAESQAMEWLEANADNALVLSSPDLGLIIPARSDARVVYGHPFETAHAADQKRAVENFYRGDASALDLQSIAYILYGPRERALGSLPTLPDWRIVFPKGDALIEPNVVLIYGR